MPSISMHTCPEMFVLLIHCITDDTLSHAMPDLRQALRQFTDVVVLTSAANVSMHAKEDILAFNVTHEYINNEVYLVNFDSNEAKW